METSTETLVTRLQAKDPTLWGEPDTPELADRLGWIDLPQTIRTRLGELGEIAETALAAGTESVVLLGMGGSSLAPEVFGAVIGSAPGHPSLVVLDSTHPDQVARVASSIDPHRTIFIVSSKSGGTLETISGFRYFWRLTNGDGSRFVAVTDPGSSLADLAVERGFRSLVLAPPDVGGRFSAFTPFGLLPAAMIGVDLERLVTASREVDWGQAVQTGIEWGEAAGAGRDKLTFVTSPDLAAFPAWLEQLVAESLGKDGKGIVPVAGEPALERYGDDRIFREYRLDDTYRLGTEMMAAMIATSIAGRMLGVHPFDQPDVELAKQRARQALEVEPARVDLVDVSAPVLSDRLDELMMTLGPTDYFAVQAFLPYRPVVDASIAELRHKIGNRSGNATTVGYGPRFLHSTGQLHKGGSNNGVFLQLVDSPTEDMAIPETSTTFGKVIAAQALGDYQALRERNRRVLRVDLGPDVMGGLGVLFESIG
ncbi:MAG: glucose-6-phosphate isomerase [Actinomycetota bacterium]